MNTLYLDLESYCEVPITHGTYAYAEQAEVMLIAHALNDSPVEVFDNTQPASFYRTGHLAGIVKMAKYADEIVIHNSMFDRTVLHNAFDFGFDIPVEKISDTMVRALMHGLPGGLDKLCGIFKLPPEMSKDKDGRKFINLFCKPQNAKSKIRRATRETHPEEWKGFIEYAKRDIMAMRELHRRLPRWNNVGKELTLWHLDQHINDRGYAVDLDLARGAIAAVGDEQARLAKRTQHLTDGAVSSATKRDEMLKHIARYYGINLPDMQKDTLERRLTDPELPLEFKELLAVRLQSTTTSTSKYKTLVNGVSQDGRLRGTLQFCGANRTGRWAGRLFQPQNLPRPQVKQADIGVGIRALKSGIADLMFDNVMEIASAAVRGCIIAPAGRKLVIADLANIEGRAVAWLSGESWKLDAFRAYDAGTGHDLYKVAYGRAFGIRPEAVDDAAKSGPQRQIGKVMELMLGYQGGVGAFITGAATYGIDLDAMAETAWASIPQNIKEDARKWLYTDKNKQGNYGLSEKTYIVCDSLKRMWRLANPAITNSWNQIGDMTRSAIANSGKRFTRQASKTSPSLVFIRDGSWLRIILPSGRSLCYASPAIEDDGRISYWGIGQYTKQWQKHYTYGGKLVENITQAVARDVMADPMPRIDEAGYEILLTVHDELITETLDSPEFNAEELAAMMSTQPSWAAGLPLAASGFEAKRYRKD